MTQETGQRWLITSAFVVGGVYAYMKWRDRTQTPVSEFATAWGAVFFILALVTEAAPGFGGAFSILVMTSDLLANAPTLTTLVRAGQVPGATRPQTTTRAAATR